MRKISITNIFVGTLFGLALAINVFLIYKEALKYFAPPPEYRFHGTVNIALAESFKEYLLKYDGRNVTVHIESFGGLVLSMNKMIYYMDKSNSKIHCYVDSHSASAASIILMRCDTIEATPKAWIHFHVMQICTKRGIFGCIEQRAVSPDFHPELYQESLELLAPAKYVLTTKQWEDLINSKDVIITGKQLMEMLRNIPTNKVRK